MASTLSPIDWYRSPRPSVALWGFGFAAIAVCAPLVGEVLFAVSAALFQENGVIETSQILLLAVAAWFFACAFMRSAEARAAFCALMVLGSLLALQREIPACESAFYEGGVCAARSTKIVLSGIVVLVCASVLLARGVRWRGFFALRNCIWVWPVALSGALLTLAELAEHLVHIEIEEMLELGAYAYLAAFAAWLARSRRSDIGMPMRRGS